jgi:hypothetical protein
VLEVSVDNFLSYEGSFTSLADAQTFFTDDPINLGYQPGGLEDVKLVFDLTSSYRPVASSSTMHLEDLLPFPAPPSVPVCPV